MLKQFEVTNFKNFKDKFIFDLSSKKNYTFNGECVENNIVKKSLIYGPNGCGKSNLGIAIFDIRTHFSDDKTDIIYKKNYLNAASDSGLAEFKYTFQFGKDILEYSYGKKSVDELVYETVKINDKEVISLDRSKSNIAEIDLKGAETLNRDLGNSKLSVIKYIKNNSILSESMINLIFNNFFEFVNLMIIIKTIDSYINIEFKPSMLSEILLEFNKTKELEDYLNSAGITCKLKIVQKDNEQLLYFDYKNKNILFSEIASTGTLALTDQYVNFILLKELIKKFDDNSSKDNKITPFIFIDEFDAFYHQNVSKQIVKELKEMNAQSILTTHNTTIMSNDLLRPDCYFLMNETSIKPIYKFTDKELRKAHNIEKMYKAGAFNE